MGWFGFLLIFGGIKGSPSLEKNLGKKFPFFFFSCVGSFCGELERVSVKIRCIFVWVLVKVVVVGE